jgi:DNA-binding HxlR family transcriptional regulator
VLDRVRRVDQRDAGQCAVRRPRRPRRVRHALPGHRKVITQALRRLLAGGLVARRAERAAPPRVEYRLTPLGVSLAGGPLRALADWTLTHGEQLLEAQERAAARPGTGAAVRTAGAG